MKTKKKLFALVASLITVLMLPFSYCTAFAANPNYHAACIFGGHWNSNKQSNLVFYVLPDAITSNFTQSMYSNISQWNNISSNVHVSAAFPAPQVNLTNKSLIYNSSDLAENVVGQTVLYNANGVDLGVPNTWSAIEWASIRLNISYLTTEFNNPVVAASKTVKHEVGHALLLPHPVPNTSLSGHSYQGEYDGQTVNGLPISIMNQGYPNYVPVSSSVSYHDQNQLKNKWGE